MVTGDKLSVQTLVDRKVYSVSTDVQTTFGTLSDILGVIPSVDVDGDGVVSLRGDTHVLILIDGRPSTQFAGASAGDNLQSISAADVERIEILTTPPAQFKAEGAAGVINIVTRQKRPAGGAGSMRGSLGSGGRSLIGADGSYSSDRLTASASAGYRHDLRQRVTQSTVTTAATADAAPGDTQSTIEERIRRAVPTLGLAARYVLNARQSISGSANWSQRGGLRTYSETDTAALPVGSLTALARRLSYGHDPETDRDFKLGFQQLLGPAGAVLELSLHRSESRQHERYDYIDDSFIPPTATLHDGLGFSEDHGITEAGADLALPLSKAASVKLGYEFEQDDYAFGNAGYRTDPLTGARIPDAALTNDFHFRQAINTAYASYQAGAGAWRVLGGVRVEATRTDARQLTDNIGNATRYLRAYPSFHVDYGISDTSTMSFGASRRITRPDPDSLNPYIDYEYAPNLRAGNPNLRPQFTQSYELGYGAESHAVSYGMTAYYRLNRDPVTDITDYLGNGLSLTTKTNLPKNDSAGLELTASGRLVRQLSYDVSANPFHTRLDAAALGTSGLQATSGLNAKVKLDYRPAAATSLQLTFSRTDRRLTPQGYVGAIDIVNIGARYQVTANLNAVATVSDLFDGQRLQRFAATAGFTQEYERTVLGRMVYIGVVLAFGAAGKDKDKQHGFDYDPSG